jgi:hypothetical protein
VGGRELEISGMDKATQSAIQYRLSQKAAQARAGESGQSARACVVAFEARFVALAALEGAVLALRRAVSANGAQVESPAVQSA